MKVRVVMFFALLGMISLLFFSLAMAQMPTDPVASGTNVTATTADIQWIWGEVISFDPTAKTIRIKYPDYETDQEKEMSVDFNGSTTYENVASLEEIKPADTLSIDYVSIDGKAMAKNISVEKPDLTPINTTATEEIPVTNETVTQ